MYVLFPPDKPALSGASAAEKSYVQNPAGTSGTKADSNATAIEQSTSTSKSPGQPGGDIASASAGTDAMAAEVDGGKVEGLKRQSFSQHHGSSASETVVDDGSSGVGVRFDGGSKDGKGGEGRSSGHYDEHHRPRSLVPPLDGEDEASMQRRIAEDKRRRESMAEKGSGTKVVKSSGLAADGGDFDATKPGAGREADRMLYSLFIHSFIHTFMFNSPCLLFN